MHFDIIKIAHYRREYHEVDCGWDCSTLPPVTTYYWTESPPLGPTSCVGLEGSPGDSGHNGGP